MKKILCVLIIIVSCGFCAENDVSGMILSHPITVIKDFSVNGDGWAREPVLRRMPDGSLLCLHYTGGPWEPDDANYAEATRSYDDGKTWTAGEKLFDHPSKAVWTPEMFVVGDDVYVMVHTFNTSSWYCGLNVFWSLSKDSGKTWTEPTTMPGHSKSFSHRRGIVMSNGQWFFPIYCQEQREGFDVSFDRKNYAHGKNWPFCVAAMVCKPGWEDVQVYGYKSGEKVFLWENNVVELEPGHLIMLMRASGTKLLYRMDSYDYGKTWTNATATDIPNGDSKITLFKIGDSVVLLGNQCGNRSSLSLWVSNDNLQTWETKIELAKIGDPKTMPQIEHNPKMICYPEGFADEEKEVFYMAFENGITHFLMKIPFSDFL